MTKRMEAPVTVPAGGVFTWDAASADAGMKAWAKWMGDWSGIQQESAQFVQNRLHRDAEAVARILSCKDPGEALELQYRYARDAFDDYLGETQRLTTKFTQSATRNLLA